MTPKAREDAIGIGCAIGGAAFGQYVIGPLVGGFAPLAAGICGALGWGLAKAIITSSARARMDQREEGARESREANEREFAQRLKAHFDDGLAE
jgi:hypothetical protein